MGCNKFKVEGYCKTCKTSLIGKCYTKPIATESVTFFIQTKDSRGIPHTVNNKRRLAGIERKQVKEQLLYMNPKQFRREQVREHMKHGDCEPSFLQPLPVLHKAAHEARYEQLGIEPRSKLFDSLAKLKTSAEMNKFIKAIGYDKFFVMY